MTWTERVIGIGLSILITASVLLAAAYGPLYLMSYLQKIPLHRVLGLMNGAFCMFFVWRVVRAYSTGSIRRGHLRSIERQDHPFKFWVYISLEMLLVATFGYLALRSLSS